MEKEDIGIDTVLRDFSKYDFHLAEHLISEGEKALLDEWKKQDFYSFASCLRKLWQDIETCKIEPRDNQESISRQIAKLEGVLSVYESFWRDSVKNRRSFKNYILLLSKVEGEFNRYRGGINNMEKNCESCKWHDDFSWACFNGDSPYCADFTHPEDTCQEYETPESQEPSVSAASES